MLNRTDALCSKLDAILEHGRLSIPPYYSRSGVCHRRYAPIIASRLDFRILRISVDVLLHTLTCQQKGGIYLHLFCFCAYFPTFVSAIIGGITKAEQWFKHVGLAHSICACVFHAAVIARPLRLCKCTCGMIAPVSRPTLTSCQLILADSRTFHITYLAGSATALTTPKPELHSVAVVFHFIGALCGVSILR